MRRFTVGLVGVAIAIASATNAGAIAPPSVRVTPHAHVRDGRQVIVHWSGMLAPKRGRTDHFLQVAECNRAFTVESASEQTYAQDCDEYHAQPSDHHDFYVGTVHAGAVGLANLPCSGTGTCEIAVVSGHTDAAFHLVIERVAVAPIDFRA